VFWILAFARMTSGGVSRLEFGRLGRRRESIIASIGDGALGPLGVHAMALVLFAPV
jgi:hypothetical protein